MIDWISCKALTDASHLETGHIVSTDKDDVILYDINKWEQMELEGSSSRRIALRPCEPSPACRDRAYALDIPCPDTVLSFSGNPAKAAQGHNCWGPPPTQAEPLVLDVVRHLPQDSDIPPAMAIFDITRIDIAIMIDLKTDRYVDQYIETIGRQSRSHQGRAMMAESTVYWGKNSRRWTLKAYNKHKELLVPGHGPTDPVLLRNCREATEGILRMELTLRALELERIKRVDDDLVLRYFARVGVSGMRAYENWNDIPLRGKALDKFKLWLIGEPIRLDMPDRTFYRIRRQILDACGADISLPPASAKDRFPITDYDLTYLKAHIVPCTIALADTLWYPGREWTSDHALRCAN